MKIFLFFTYSKYVILLLLFNFLGFVLKIGNEKYRNIWLISERGTDARDNGYHFFKYINNEHPEIKSYFVIDANSPDYNKVKKIGKIIKFRSFKHYLFLGLSEYKISTHIMGYMPAMNIFAKIDRKMELVYGKKVFLQHGIIKDNLPGLYYPNVRLDLFVCGAYPEYLYVKKQFKHPSGVVQYLGLCRYDSLYNGEKNMRRILIMPTWRSYLNNLRNIDDFKTTNFYNKYQALLTNEKLINLSETYNMEIIFYPHIELQKYIKAFKTYSDNIKIAGESEYDVQELLIDSNLLITDYSSVFFDFAYMKKPIIFYQFDCEEYRKYHYSEGYFDYKKDGFGIVEYDADTIVENIKKLFEKNFTNRDVFDKKQEIFFPLHDTGNCKRTFDAISKL